MCDLLGINQGWWSVAGLFIDIVGVTIVAKNWRRVMMASNARSTAALWSEAELAVARVLEARPPFVPSDNSELARARAEHRQFRWDTDAATLRAAMFVSGDQSLLSRMNAILADPMAGAPEVRSLFDEARTAIDQQFRESEKAEWDPSTVALLLIVVGFAMQLVGSWPC